MLLILPPEDDLTIDVASFDALQAALSEHQVTLSLRKWSFDSESALKAPLRALGMEPRSAPPTSPGWMASVACKSATSITRRSSRWMSRAPRPLRSTARAPHRRSTSRSIDRSCSRSTISRPDKCCSSAASSSREQRHAGGSDVGCRVMTLSARSSARTCPTRLFTLTSCGQLLA